MNRMRKVRTILVCIWLFAIVPLFAGGWANWYAETPGGNQISWEYGVIGYSSAKGDVNIEGLESWYFYDGRIVGILKSPHAGFVVDERTNAIQIFDDRMKWQSYCAEAKIVPRFWTRWYSTDWRFFGDSFALTAYVFVMALFPVVIVLSGFLLFQVLARERALRRRPWTLMGTAVLFFAIVRLLLDLFPQSV